MSKNVDAAPLTLRPHPRLYITPAHFAELQRSTDLPLLKAAQEQTALRAARALDIQEVEVDKTGHNWHLVRARAVQGNVVSMLVEYKRTGDRRFRDGILRNVDTIGAWEYWSWIRWRANDANPEAIFDLSYGENSATLAIVFDALKNELTDSERDKIIDIARRRALKPYLARVDVEKPEWWHTKPDTNWNTVCNGGAGMLALALHEFCPEAPRVLQLADAGIVPYFEFLKDDGAWPEGIGYWNYGMRYAFMYLLSHEAATGRKHPLMERRQTQTTLTFPLVLTPNAVPCSFGDVNMFVPLPFHYAIAERYGRWDIIDELDPRFQFERHKTEGWPTAAELLLLHPRSRRKPAAAGGAWKTSALMAGLEWAYFADQMPRPTLYFSVRGGTTKAPHTHDDLLSFFCVVNDEALIDNVPVKEYHDSTFSPRRFDLYEMRADSKNTIFINGVSTIRDATVQSTLVEGPCYRGVRLDATQAIGLSRDGAAASFCGRAILLVKDSVVLVLDRAEVPHPALFESRLHTYSAVDFEKLSATLRGKRNTLHLAVAATENSLLRRGMGTPTSPKDEPDTMIRHCSAGKQLKITMAALLTPNGTGAVTLKESNGKAVAVISGRIEAEIEFNPDGLRL